MSANYVADLAVDLIEAATDAIDEPRSGHVLPVRIYVAHTAPAVERGCEQLTVHMDPARSIWNRAKPASPRVPERCQVALVARFILQLWRCWPESDNELAVTPAAYSAAAAALHVDLWCLETFIVQAAFAGTLFTGMTCKEVTTDSARGLGPQGGMAGWELPIEVLLSDGGPVDAS